MNRLKREESEGLIELEKDLNIQQTKLNKLLDKQKKQDTDYYAGEIRAALYNRLSEEVEGIKRIVFWFSEDDSFTKFALPSSDVQRTVP